MTGKLLYIFVFSALIIQPIETYDYYEVDTLPKFREENIKSYVFNHFVPHQYFEGYDEVYVTFIVKKDGSIADVKIIRTAFEYNGKEVSRILKSMPKWRPAIKDSMQVNCKMMVSFRIGIVD